MNAFRFDRRIGFLLCACIALALPLWAHAQAYPSRPVTLIVPFPAGGSVDMMNRVTAEKLGQLLGQNFVVDFKPGAGGNIGAEAVAKSKPDGYTLAFIAMPHAIGRSVYAKLGYDLLRDLEPVAIYVETAPILIVHPSLGAKSVADLVQLAKAQPGRLEYGTGGNGTSAHLMGERLKRQAGIDLLHVPYKGAAPAMNDLLAGRVKIMFETAPGAVPQIKAGKVVPLAVLAPVRTSALPELPTIAEAGFPGLEFVQWGGLMAPTGTPREVIDALSAAVARIEKMADVRQRFLEAGAQYMHAGPEEFRTRLHADVKSIEEVVRAAGITAN